MQDGQNLFDANTAFGAEWQVDEHMQRLASLGLEAIVVGVPNAGEQRLFEYTPFVDAEHGGGGGDRYLAFLIDTLKPEIDRRFRTRPEREATGIMGSSLGGLISLYAFLTRSEVFGFAGAMSPSVWFADARILQIAAEAPPPRGRLYVDVGTGEGDRHVALMHDLHRLLIGKGLVQGVSLFYVEEDEAPHCETAWANRLRTALYFLLPVTSGTEPGAAPGDPPP
jgi:predicted alpha/beta superfamily hydrolase